VFWLINSELLGLKGLHVLTAGYIHQRDGERKREGKRKCWHAIADAIHTSPSICFGQNRTIKHTARYMSSLLKNKQTKKNLASLGHIPGDKTSLRWLAGLSAWPSWSCLPFFFFMFSQGFWELAERPARLGQKCPKPLLKYSVKTDYTV